MLFFTLFFYSRRCLYNSQNQPTSKPLQRIPLPPCYRLRQCGFHASRRRSAKLADSRRGILSNRYIVPAYYGLPPGPYVALGYLGATTAPVRRRGVVEFGARRAKEIGGDAILVQSSGSDYAGTVSGIGYSTTNAFGTSVPLFRGKASVLIIKFK